MEKGRRLGTGVWGSRYQSQVCPCRGTPGSGWVTLDLLTAGLGSGHRTLPQTLNQSVCAGPCCGKPSRLPPPPFFIFNGLLISRQQWPDAENKVFPVGSKPPSGRLLRRGWEEDWELRRCKTGHAGSLPVCWKLSGLSVPRSCPYTLEPPADLGCFLTGSPSPRRPAGN